jgi:hypothetical protein
VRIARRLQPLEKALGTVIGRIATNRNLGSGFLVVATHGNLCSGFLIGQVFDIVLMPDGCDGSKARRMAVDSILSQMIISFSVHLGRGTHLTQKQNALAALAISLVPVAPSR